MCCVVCSLLVAGTVDVAAAAVDIAAVDHCCNLKVT